MARQRAKRQVSRARPVGEMVLARPIADVATTAAPVEARRGLATSDHRHADAVQASGDDAARRRDRADRLGHHIARVAVGMPGRPTVAPRRVGRASPPTGGPERRDRDSQSAQPRSAGGSTVLDTMARSTGSRPSASVQRKIGFEMEYSIPLSEDAAADHDFLSREADPAAKRKMATYLTGGPEYANDYNFASGPSYKVHIDHELELQRAHIELYNVLRADGMIHEWKGGQHHMISIPEYVTDAFDEMGAYSTNWIQDTLFAISNHMTQVYTATQGGMGAFPSANGFWVGVPSQEFSDYYDRHGVDKTNLGGALRRIEAAVQDRIAPQATVGIIPSSIFQAHENLVGHMTQDRSDPGITGTDALQLSLQYTTDVMGALESDPAFADLQRDHPIAWDELKGLVTLAANYIVGEAYYRSSGFEDYKVAKNAVPLMSKIWLHTAIDSAPSLGRLLDRSMVQTLDAMIKRHPYFDPDNIRKDLGVQLRTQKLSGSPLAADATMLKDFGTDPLVANMFGGGRVDHRGKRFDRADAMIAALRAASDNQSGVPMEYRRLAMRPSAAGLYAALWPLVEESRALNMRHMTEAQRDNTQWWADTSRLEAIDYFANQATQSLASWGRALLPRWGRRNPPELTGEMLV